jgi:hypothetical protein
MAPCLARFEVLGGDEAAHAQLAVETVVMLLLLLLLLLLLEPHAAALPVIPRSVVVSLQQQHHHACIQQPYASLKRIAAAAVCRCKPPPQPAGSERITRGVEERADMRRMLQKITGGSVGRTAHEAMASRCASTTAHAACEADGCGGAGGKEGATAGGGVGAAAAGLVHRETGCPSISGTIPNSVIEEGANGDAAGGGSSRDRTWE